MPTRRALFASAVLGPLFATVRATAAQDATPVAIRYDRDVLFGEIDGKPLLLDVAHPAPRAASRPAVIVIHGGGLEFCDRSCLADPMPHLAEAGYVAVNIEYRLFDAASGNDRWPAQLDDVQRAVRWVRANAATYGIDPERVGAFGHSSGAQLAAFLGTRDTRANSDATLADHPSRVTCVVDIAGTMDLTMPYPGAPTAALGGTADAPPDAAAYRDFSPIAFVDAETVPFLILQGGHDDLCPPEQSRKMTDALHEADVEVVAAEFPGLDHFSILDWSVIGPETLAFLGRHLRPEE